MEFIFLRLQLELASLSLFSPVEGKAKEVKVFFAGFVEFYGLGIVLVEDPFL